MYYEINVALNGKHYFATAKHSVTHSTQAKAITQDFQQRFPATEGFSISVTLYVNRGVGIKATNMSAADLMTAIDNLSA